MKKFKAIILIATFLLFCSIGTYSANIEILPEFSDKSLSVHTENIRRLNTDLIDVVESASASVATIESLQASLDTAWASIEILEGAGDGTIKAWINFDGNGTIAINDSFNVSSIHDWGVGDYTIYWDTDFATATYCITGSVRYTIDGGVAHAYISIANYTTALVAGSARINTVDRDGTKLDCEIVNVIAVGRQ